MISSIRIPVTQPKRILFAPWQLQYHRLQQQQHQQLQFMSMKSSLSKTSIRHLRCTCCSYHTKNNIRIPLHHHQQQQIYFDRKHWKSSVTTTSSNFTNSNSKHSNSSSSKSDASQRQQQRPRRKQQQLPQKLRNNDYYSNESWDGLFRTGMTAPLKIKLNNYYTSSSSSSPNSNNNSINSNGLSPTRKVIDDQTIATWTTQMTNLVLDYHTKNIHRREDVRDALLTHPESIALVSSIEELLPQPSTENTDTSINNCTDDNTDSGSVDANTNVVYDIFKNIEIESLLMLRVDVEKWMDQYEILKLERFLNQNDLNDDTATQEVCQQHEMQLSIAKRWTTIFVAVLLHSIPNYVVARRIQPKDVTMDLIKVSTVHAELPEHYNDHFNPFTGVHNRVYGVYLNKTKPISTMRDPLIPSRIIEGPPPTTTQEQVSLEEPIVILCVSLQPKVPRSLREIFCSAPKASCTVTNTIPSVSTDSSPRTVATFYSILNVQHQQYSKLKLGEFLIHEAVKLLQAESSPTAANPNGDVDKTNDHNIIRVRNETTTTEATSTPTIDTFVTLSPLPGFCTWLLNEIDICIMYCDPDYFFDETTGQGIIRRNPALYHTIQFLSRQWMCEIDDVVMKITDYLYARSERERNKEKSKSQRKQQKVTPIPIDGIETPQSMTPTSSPQIQAAIRYFLEGMAAHYVVHAKIGDTNGTTTMSTSTATNKPTNGVARFHLQNGAEVYRINAFADLSMSGINASLSVMVNYRYHLPQLLHNQAQYNKNYNVSIHDYVKQQLQ